jgi:hypothetical protein
MLRRCCQWANDQGSAGSLGLPGTYPPWHLPDDVAWVVRLSALHDLEGVKRDELALACEDLGLPKSGTKAKLLGRLSAALDSGGASGSSSGRGGGGGGEGAGAGECVCFVWWRCP